MRVLKQILFTVALLIGISITASAQSGGQPKKIPPKPPPPVIKVEEKKPPPRDDKKNDGKKPGMAWVMARRESDAVSV